MTDEKKPREFWILDKWLTFPNGPELVCYNEKPHQVYTSKGADIYHVIEKAYADKLLARIEKLREGLCMARLHTMCPDLKPSPWSDYLQDLLDKTLLDDEAAK